MAPVTTPGKKVKASNVDRNDPKEILKDRKLTQYLNEANTMSNEAGKMEKDIQDMTQQELLSAIADEGDKARLSGKHRQPPPGDPSTWKFEGRTQELLDAYNAKFVPEEPYLADDVEHFCICNGSDDGRAMIECSNGSACLMNWFHLNCIGMGNDEIPEDQEDWFCKRCTDNKLGKLRKNAPKSISQSVVKKANADRIKHYEAVEQKAGKARAGGDGAKRRKLAKKEKSRDKIKEKQKQKTLAIRTTPSKPLELSTPSPGSPGPWTAELDKTFAEDPEVAETYNLRSMGSAKAALLFGATTVVPTASPTVATTAATNAVSNAAATDDGGNLDMSDTASEASGKRNKGSWTEKEKAYLVDCVTASHQAGHRGEALWSHVYPNMVALGVDRPLGGMRNIWLRELREQANLDERRRQNASKMRTAIQKSKKEKEAEKAANAAAEDAEMKDGEEEKEEMEVAAALAMMPIKPIACRARGKSV